MGFLKGILLILGLFVFGLIAFALSLFALILSPIEPRLRFRANSLFLIPFGIYARAVIGVKLVFINRENILLARPAVLIGNHQSASDLGIIGTTAPPGSVIVAKKEIQNIPLFGWFFKIAGNLMIDRKKSFEAKGQMESVKAVLKKRNLNLIIFPEGTRSKDQQFLPFKKGAFHLAVATGYPLIPVVCSSLRGKAVWENFDLAGGHVVISVLPPVVTAGLGPSDVESLRAEVRDSMLAEYERINALALDYDQGKQKKPAPGCCS